MKTRAVLTSLSLVLLFNSDAAAKPQAPEPIVIEAMTTSMARTLTANPSCVWEQVGRPFSGLPLDANHPEGFLHLNAYAPQSCIPATAPVHRIQTASDHACDQELQQFTEISGPLSSSVSMWWGEDGSLREVYSMVTTRRTISGPTGILAGQFGTAEERPNFDLPPPIVGAPTYSQFTNGAPIVVTMDWVHGNDWILLDAPDEQVALDEFQEIYGYDPRDAILTATIEYQGNIEPMIWGPTSLFGGRVRYSLDVSRNPNISDWNRDNVTSMQDLFGFLSAYFAGSPRASSLGGDTTCCDVLDIFAYLQAFFAQR